MDEYAYNSDAVSDPARSTLSIVPSDDQALKKVPKALFVGTGGDVVLRAAKDENPVTFRNVADGSILPVRAAQVYQSGTTAADMLALY